MVHKALVCYYPQGSGHDATCKTCRYKSNRERELLAKRGEHTVQQVWSSVLCVGGNLPVLFPMPCSFFPSSLRFPLYPPHSVALIRSASCRSLLTSPIRPIG